MLTLGLEWEKRSLQSGGHRCSTGQQPLGTNQWTQSTPPCASETVIPEWLWGEMGQQEEFQKCGGLQYASSKACEELILKKYSNLYRKTAQHHWLQGNTKLEMRIFCVWIKLEIFKNIDNKLGHTVIRTALPEWWFKTALYMYWHFSLKGSCSRLVWLRTHASA